MGNIYIKLRREAQDRLREIALNERRRPQDQAAYMLERMLLAAEQPNQERDQEAASAATGLRDKRLEEAMKSPELTERAKLIRDEIEQIFTDATCWNENHRTPEEVPIDPDPDGELKRAAEALDLYIAANGE